MFKVFGVVVDNHKVFLQYRDRLCKIIVGMNFRVDIVCPNVHMDKDLIDA